MEHADHDPARDRELGMDRPIARRDFLNGLAVAVGGALAGTWLPPFAGRTEAVGLQDAAGSYPPDRSGMRGQHPGAFEVAHAVRDGQYVKPPAAANTKETYDVVIVGAGFSGLAAAYYYRDRVGPSARILLLDCMDDFGGHAKRNEFHVGGRMLISYGGTQLISSPFPYSKQARKIMDDLGIDPVALTKKCVVPDVYKGLQNAYFFDKETFGTDRLVIGSPSNGADAAAWKAFLTKTPLSPEVQRDVARIEAEKLDYLPGLTSAQKKDRLSRISYKDYLLTVVKANPGVMPLYQKRPHGLMAIGSDGLAALDGWVYGYPGFQGLNLEPGPAPRMQFTARGEATPQAPPYTFLHPDGMASVARQIVRSLIPAALTGRTPEDIISATTDYGQLDKPGAPIRIRLNSTVVRVLHLGAPASAKEVDVTYVSQGKAYSVRGRGVVMACHNAIIPRLCPEMPPDQQANLKYGVRAPLIYTAVAINNWTAFSKLGIRNVSSPGMYHGGVNLDQAIDIGDYKSPKKPEEPIVLRMTRVPLKAGLPQRDQFRIGHLELLATTFETFERNIRDQIARILAPGGFDPARDIAAITVNRWSHGYAYEYSSLWDPDLPEEKLPYVLGRKPFGRITIANSDSEGSAYADLAMNAGYRAVQDLFGSGAKTA
jgi:spermidine dehydrogenase